MNQRTMETKFYTVEGAIELSPEQSDIKFSDRTYPVRRSLITDFKKTNHKAGIPAYIKIDMATQNTECVKLKETIILPAT